MNSARNSLKNILRLIFYVPYFFFWHYIRRTIDLVRFIWRTTLFIADGFSIFPMIRYLFAPYHEDRTWIGRLMGLILRSFWLIVTIPMSLVFFLLLLLLLPLHLILPFSFYFGMAFTSYFDVSYLQIIVVTIGWLLTTSSIFLYFLEYVRMPKLTLEQFQKANKSEEIDFKKLEKTFMPDLKKDWYKAFDLAASDDDLEDLSYYLFLAMVLNKRNRYIFYRLNLTPKIVYKMAEENKYNLQKSFIPLSELFRKEIEVAEKLDHHHLDSDVLLVTLVQHNKAIHDLFIDLGISNEEIEKTSGWIYEQIKRRDNWKYWKKPKMSLRGGPDRAWVSGWIPTLKQFSTDITSQVSQGYSPPFIGRKKEIEQIVRVLTMTTKNNVIMLGPPGVGKTAIVYGIAKQIISGAIPDLKGKRLLSLDFASLISGATARGDFEGRLKKSLDESGPGLKVIFIDEIAAHFDVGGDTGAISAANLLLPYITTGAIQCIGATSYQNYHQVIEQNPAFSNFFQTVKIEEPDEAQAIEILESFVGMIEHKQKVMITYQAVEQAVKLSRQYIRDRVLPEKAIDILDETAVDVRRTKKKIVTDEDVARIISLKTGIPVAKVSEAEKEKLLNLEERLHKRIIGQEEAVKVIANAMRRARVGLKDAQKPIARFLFLGPTGVGKTETCKALSELYFGEEENMIRLDMSEYQNSNSLDRLIGAPPGTKDHTSGGQLTEAVRKRPFSVIMLDELEKAHPQILDLFLQVLDDGRLTDSSGRVISFQESIIIATSNAQAILIQDAVKKGYSHEDLKKVVFDNLTQNFRPEFINRFDATVVFKPLDKEAVLQIAVLMLQKVKDRLAEKEIGLEISPEALLQISRLGYSPEYGARPLRRVIQEKVEDQIARDILENKVKPGEVITIDQVE